MSNTGGSPGDVRHHGETARGAETGRTIRKYLPGGVRTFAMLSVVAVGLLLAGGGTILRPVFDRAEASGGSFGAATGSEVEGGGRSAPEGPPETFVAVRETGTKLVLVETETGRIRRTLVDLGPPPTGRYEPLIQGLAISPDGRTVYYSAPNPELTRLDLYQVLVTGGSPELLVSSGDDPAVSPDGARLAYLPWTGGEGALVVRDLRTGHEDRWDAGENFTYVSGEMAWAQDSRHLAMLAWGLEGATFISVLDTQEDRTLSDSDPVPNPTAESQVSPTYRSSDRLGMIRVCCPGPEGRWTRLRRL